MEKIPLWAKVLVTIAVAAGALFMVDVAFGLMNQKSTVFFWGGVLLLSGTAILGLAYVRKLVKKVKISSGGTNLLGLIVCLALAGPLLSGCTRIGPGYVGIKVDMTGDKRGVNDYVLSTGWVFYNLFNQQVFEYPTFVQTAVWTKDETEGSPTNEEVSFNSKEGLTITGDISLSYMLVAEKVPAFYVKYRNDDLNNFTHGYLRNVARDLFNEVAGKYSVEELYGPQKDKFLSEVRARLNSDLASVGLIIEQFGFIGAPRPPQGVVDALNAKVAATQLAMQTENELRRAEAEAKKRIAAAQGEAEANRLLAISVTPALLQLRYLQALDNAISKWDGKRPMVEGEGSGLLLQLPQNILNRSAATTPVVPAPSPKKK
ncbi:MAG: SPFH domain-containing protein [bacterium]|nr:SPFH domain-containing protein [bacterium]